MGIVSVETPEIARTPPWIEQNNRAMLIIFRACESSQQDIIDDQLDAFSTWKKLQEVYQSRDAASVQRLYNEFTNLRPPRGAVLVPVPAIVYLPTTAVAFPVLIVDATIMPALRISLPS